MLIVDQYEPGTFKTTSIVEEVDVYYAQGGFKFLSAKFCMVSITYYGFKILILLVSTTFYGFKIFILTTI